MENQETSQIMQEILATLKADIHAVGTDEVFMCRPIKWTTFERDTALGRFRGEVNLADLAEFTSALNDLVTDRVLKVILDFNDVSLSKTAIGAIVAFAATMHGKNKRLYLFRASEQVRESLEQLGLTPFFSYLKEEEDIVATLVI